MENEKKTYETTFIINATLEDPQVEAAIEKVKELITKNDGEIIAVEKWGRKRLAYSIKKKNNGYYTLIEFRAPGDLVAKLERYYQLDEQTLRYLTVQLDKKALKAKELAAQRATIAEPTGENPPVETQPAA